MGAVNRPMVGLRGLITDAAARTAVELFSETGVPVADVMPYLLAANAEDLRASTGFPLAEGFNTSVAVGMGPQPGEAWLVLGAAVIGQQTGDTATVKPCIVNRDLAPVYQNPGAIQMTATPGFAPSMGLEVTAPRPIIMMAGDVFGAWCAGVTITPGTSYVDLVLRFYRARPAY